MLSEDDNEHMVCMLASRARLNKMLLCTGVDGCHLAACMLVSDENAICPGWGFFSCVLLFVRVQHVLVHLQHSTCT